MVKTFLQVKKAVSLNGSTILPVGCVDKDSVKKLYPFIDFNNGEYFDVKDIDLLTPGTKVKYRGYNYYIIKATDTVRRNIYNRLVVQPYPIDGYKVKVSYMIGSGLTVREKDMKQVTIDEIEIAPIYWFLNSKGDVCQAVEGENKRADEWRKITNNYWHTKESCEIQKREIEKQQ